MATQLPKSVIEDNRPRHVRFCHQELEKGARLVINRRQARARLCRDGMDTQKIALKHAQEVRDDLGEAFGKQIILVLPDRRATLSELERLTVNAIIARWPQLGEHYKDAKNGLYQAAYAGKITKTPNGWEAEYLIDDAFFAWLDSIGIDASDVEHEQVRDAAAEVEADIEEPPVEEEPEEVTLAQPNASDVEHEQVRAESGDGAVSGSTGTPEVRPPEIGVPGLLDELRASHVWFVEALHGGGNTSEAREAAQGVIAALRRRMAAVDEIIDHTERSLHPPTSPSTDRVAGALSRITGDEKLQRVEA